MQQNKPPSWLFTWKVDLFYPQKKFTYPKKVRTPLSRPIAAGDTFRPCITASGSLIWRRNLLVWKNNRFGSLLEQQQQSDVQLTKLRTLSETPRPSRKDGTEGFKGCPQLNPPPTQFMPSDLFFSESESTWYHLFEYWHSWGTDWCALV